MNNSLPKNIHVQITNDFIDFTFYPIPIIEIKLKSSVIIKCYEPYINDEVFGIVLFKETVMYKKKIEYDESIFIINEYGIRKVMFYYLNPNLGEIKNLKDDILETICDILNYNGEISIIENTRFEK